jgi:hypothetical protein
MLVTLVGCGGGAEEPAGEVTTQTQATPPAPEDAAGEEVAIADASPAEPQAFEPFPTADEVLTSEIAERLEAEQPMIILFYDEAQQTSDDQRAQVDAVLADYRGLIELVAYDVGEYVQVDEDGSITVLPDMAKDESAQKVARLFSEDYLGITFTPYLVFVNADGYITYRYRGFVDSKLIEREVLRATD